MNKGNDVTGYVATEEAVVDWDEFAVIAEQPVSGDLTTCVWGDELDERVEALMREDTGLMAEAEDWMKMNEVSLRGKSDDDVISFIRDSYGSGLVDFYMENRRAMSKIF